jgi:ectoine hydroxylase
MIAPVLEQTAVERFVSRGYLPVNEELFSETEREKVREELLSVTSPPAHIVREEDGGAIRSIYDAHRASPLVEKMARHPFVVGIAEHLLGGPVYHYQVKINFKAPLSGKGVWPWHSDFLIWHHEDGLPAPEMLTVAIHIDTAHEHNGPLLVSPASHLEPIAGISNASNDRSSSRDLSYPLDQSSVTRILNEHGIETVTGPAGSIVVFDSRILHASGPNLSPTPRTVMLLRFNRLSNVPPVGKTGRPAWLANPNPSRVTPMA